MISSHQPKRIYVKSGESYSDAVVRYRTRCDAHRDAHVMYICEEWRRRGTVTNRHLLRAFFGVRAVDMMEVMS